MSGKYHLFLKNPFILAIIILIVVVAVLKICGINTRGVIYGLVFITGAIFLHDKCIKEQTADEITTPYTTESSVEPQVYGQGAEHQHNMPKKINASNVEHGDNVEHINNVV